MFRSHRVSSRSDEGELTFRIVGRKKRYEISRVIGETREGLDRCIAEAISNHSRSLKDHRVRVRAGDIDIVRAMVPGRNKGPDISTIEVGHTFLSLKLTPLGLAKLSRKKTVEDGANSALESHDSETDHRRSRGESENPSDANRTARQPQTEIDHKEHKFQLPPASAREPDKTKSADIRLRRGFGSYHAGD